jgi:hypothetical protein
VRGQEIRDRLDELESQATELAEGIIGTIAEVRARLGLLETAAEMAALVEDDRVEKAATWPSADIWAELDRIRRRFNGEEA